MTACHAVDTDSNSVLGVNFSHSSSKQRSASCIPGADVARLLRPDKPGRLPEIPNRSNKLSSGIGNGYILTFNFISRIKYIYVDAVSGVMHALAKWIESDPVFNKLGTLIIAIGILALASLTLYTCGILI